MIRMIFQDLLGAVELFYQHHTHQKMRPGCPPESYAGQGLVGIFIQNRKRKSLCPSNQKRRRDGLSLALRQKLAQRFTGRIFCTRVQEYQRKSFRNLLQQKLCFTLLAHGWLDGGKKFRVNFNNRQRPRQATLIESKRFLKRGLF